VKLIEYADRDRLAIDLAAVVAGELDAALQHYATASLAVPGGSTPGAMFDVLCAADLDWGRVAVLPTDERWVALDDPRSNARMIGERLLVNRAASARLLPLYIPAPQPETVLAQIEATLIPELPISVLVLGMGEDMHTASLFPGAPGLSGALGMQAPVLVALRPGSVPEARVSLTAPVLNGALSKHLVIFGEAKRAALQRAKSLPPQEAPVGAVLNEITIHWAE